MNATGFALSVADAVAPVEEAASMPNRHEPNLFEQLREIARKVGRSLPDWSNPARLIERLIRIASTTVKEA